MWEKLLLILGPYDDDIFKLVLSLLLGGLIGWQREHTGHEAGVRTFLSICMGSCLFGLISYHISFPGDPGRIAAQIVSGIGFMGVGVIIREGGAIRGLTTAATLWASSAIGLAVAFNMYVLAIIATFLIFAFLYLPSMRNWNKFTGRKHHDTEG